MPVIAALILAAALVGADQFIKYLVVQFVKPVYSVEVIPGFLRFRYLENTGAVFGSFSAYTALLTIFSIGLLGVSIYFMASHKSKSKLVNICLLLMVSGGIGNVIDRMRLHYVIDFIEPVFVNFAVFNFADCLITVGAFLLILYLIVDLIRNPNGQKKAHDDEKA